MHLHARGRKVFAERDSTVDFGTTRVERRPDEAVAARRDLVVAIGGDGTMLHAARLPRLMPCPCSASIAAGSGFLADVGSQDVRDPARRDPRGRFVQDQRALLDARR